MLVAFSISWYFSIFSTLTTHVPGGKSIAFSVLSMAGLLCGIFAKLAHYSESGQFSSLIYLYSWNFLLAGLDTSLTLNATSHLRRLKRGPVQTFVPTVSVNSSNAMIEAASHLNPTAVPQPDGTPNDAQFRS